MTKLESLTQQLIEVQKATLKILMSWGRPQGVPGPRQRMPVQLIFDEELLPSKTQQSFKDECNINRIMAKHRKTGELTHLAQRNPQYGDFTNAADYMTACTAVMAAQADFDALSAEIRQRMDNDPAKLLEFMADPANEEEARELGLINPESDPIPGPEDQGATASGVEPPPPPMPENPSPVSGGE